jgi:hypothetical protein
MDKKIQEIFDTFILKAHQDLTSEQRSIFLHGDVGGGSYFETPRHPAQLAYVLMELNTDEELEQVFNELWANDPLLKDMIKPMLKYAFELKAKQTSQSDDLNSFIYTLY